MSFSSQLSPYFPDVQWTGGSSIHCSLAAACNLPIDFNNAKKVLKLFEHAKFGEKIYRQLVAKFPEVEWLMDAQEFHKLFMADAARFLAGMPSLDTPARLTNPSTGNKFHRVVLFKEFVGGFRFWLDPADDGWSHFGFRFRWESLLENEEENVRADARERVRLAEEEFVKVEEQIMEVAEPPQHIVQEFESELVKLEN